jgi:hypothetical protein
MAGKLKYTATDNQTVIKTADPALAEAFCEGRRQQVAGTSVNPYPANSEASAAFALGLATTTPEGLVDNCAECIPISVPALAGLTSAAAQAALLAAKLAVGKITGTTGVVSVQAPVAATKVQINTTVAFTIA